jgi:2-desacetyl-2-hydroxyethyl bacteriochlorophyllide A dehydrogenase
MHAVTYHGPGQIAVEEHPDPEPIAADDAVVRVEASGVCGSDLHIYHGRVVIEDGFIIGHEFVGTVVAAGDGVTQVAEGDRVLGAFNTACGTCWFCRRGIYQKCDDARTFGHGSTLGNLQGTQAELALVPHANFTLRRVPEGLSDEAALFAGDVMGTGYHGVVAAGTRPGDVVAVIGCGPVGLCTVMAAGVTGAAHVFAIDMVDDRLEMARSLGATPLHLESDDVKKGVRSATGGRGADVVVECVGNPDALGLAISLARKMGTISLTGVYAERAEVHMGLAWIKSLNLISGHANVVGHLDPVLALMSAGKLDPSPLVTHHLPLAEAPEAYRLFDSREALKVVLTTA